MGVKTFDRANPSVKQIETYSNFTGGINTEQSDQTMKDNQFRDLINFDMDLGGSLTKRPGLYRLPKVNLKMEIAYQESFDSINEAQESLATRVVKDSFQFFDGLHWVVNFITNQGLGVAILDKDLKVMDGPATKDKNFIFYRNIKDNIKISPYSDYYILMSSKYSVSSDIENPSDSDLKQIKLYSWNPIPYNLELGNLNKKEWIEASSKQEETLTETYYGDAVTTVTSQKQNGIDIKDLKSINIEILDKDKNETWNMFDNLNLKVEFDSIKIALNFSWVNPTILPDRPKRESYSYKIKGTSEWGDDNLLIHQMIATHSVGYYWFTFYQPNRGLVLSLKLKDDFKKLQISDIENMIIDTQTKRAFVGVVGVDNGNQRAEKFSMTEMGVIVKVQGDDMNAGSITQRFDYTPDHGFNYKNWDNDGTFTPDGFSKSRLWDLKTSRNNFFSSFGDKGINANFENILSNKDINLQIDPKRINNLFVGDSSFSIDGGHDTLTKIMPVGYVNIPNLNRLDGGILYVNGVDKETSNIRAYPSDTEILVPQIIINKKSEFNNFTSFLLPYSYKIKNPHLAGCFWSVSKIKTKNVFYEHFTDSTKLFIERFSWMGFDPEGKPFQNNAVCLASSTFFFPGVISSEENKFDSSFYIGPFSNSNPDTPSAKFKLVSTVVPYAEKGFSTPYKGWNDKFITTSDKESTLKDATILAGFGLNSYTTGIPGSTIIQKFNDNYQYSTSSILFEPLKNNSKSYATHTKYKNNDTNIYSVGFAYTGTNIKVTIKSQDGSFNPIELEQFKFAGLKDNNLYISSIKDLSTFDNLLILNGKLELLDKLSTIVNWKTFLGEEALKELSLVEEYNSKGLLALLRLTFSWTISGELKTLDPNISQTDTLLLVEYILNYDNPTFKIFGIKDNNGIIQSLKIVTTIKENNIFRQLVLLDTSITPDIPQDNYTELAQTIIFKFASVAYPKGLVNNVIQFKKLVYTKPNLNDLVYLWYNFVLFNRNKIEGKVADPNIYDSKIYKKISPDLIKYPSNSDLALTRPVALYGLYPVNEVLLVPGDNQKFQIFFGIKPPEKEGTKRDIRVSLLAMPVADYTAMILSKDFDTEKSLDWKKWDEVFPPAEGNTDKIAIWNITIPSTTSPYILIVQACEWSTTGSDGSKLGIDLSTVVETRLEMSPQSSVRERLPIPSLFDELTASTQLKMFETSSSVVAYGASNKIFFSDIGVPTFFPCTRVIQLKTPESVVSTTMFQNKLIVSTENSRHYIGGTSFDSGDSSERHSVKLISSDSGVIASKFDVPFGDRLYFLDNNGIKFLKNLYGTADKEFTFQEADLLIKAKVPPNDRDAVALAHRDKLYINFPKEQKMLVYVKQYDSWLEYKSPFMEFSRLFAKDGELYGIAQRNFNIFKFDKNVVVDGWNEDIGWEKELALDGTIYDVQKDQKGVNQTSRIVCSFKTKDLDQAYTVHQKKYKQISINATLLGTSGFITPRIEIDHNLINYRFQLEELENNNYRYKRYDKNNPAPINLINSQNFGSLSAEKLTGQERIKQQFILGQSRLGVTKDVNYIIPVREKGNTISLSIEFDSRSSIIINQIAVRFELRLPKKRNGR